MQLKSKNAPLFIQYEGHTTDAIFQTDTVVPIIAVMHVSLTPIEFKSIAISSAAIPINTYVNPQLIKAINSRFDRSLE